MKLGRPRWAVVMAGLCLVASPAQATKVDFREVMNGPNTLGNRGFVPQAFTVMTEKTIDFTYYALHDGIRWGLVTVLDGGRASEAAAQVTNPAVASLTPAGAALAAHDSRSSFTGSRGSFGAPLAQAGSIPSQPLSIGGGMISPGTPIQLTEGYGLGITGALAGSSSGPVTLYVVPGTGDSGGPASTAMAVPLPTGFFFLLTGLVGVGGAGRMRKSA